MPSRPRQSWRMVRRANGKKTNCADASLTARSPRSCSHLPQKCSRTGWRVRGRTPRPVGRPLANLAHSGRNEGRRLVRIRPIAKHVVPRFAVTTRRASAASFSSAQRFQVGWRNLVTECDNHIPGITGARARRTQTRRARPNQSQPGWQGPRQCGWRDGSPGLPGRSPRAIPPAWRLWRHG